MNSDCVVIMGSNMAENHPVGFQWVMEARERGAEVIHVDPRFTRTSATATQWVQIRAGSDIAFLGGLVHHILEHDLWFEEYVKHYTNAPVIVDEAFLDTEDLDGFFSGCDPEQGEYDIETGQYAGMQVAGSGGNIGRPGGGIMARRGHASIQGSTDIPTLFNILPGYLPMPHAERYSSFDDFVEANTSPSGWWGHFRAYWVSLMKAYFGEAATLG